MDPIAQMLTSIRNALAVQKTTVEVPFSKLKYEIAKVLEEQGFIKKVDRKGKKSLKNLEITLKYNKDKTPVISGLKKVSKSGQRIYANSISIKKVKGGEGAAIISTSKGLMTDKQARKQKLGGEVICEIW